MSKDGHANDGGIRMAASHGDRSRRSIVGRQASVGAAPTRNAVRQDAATAADPEMSDRKLS
jgi:hypothetical protein